MTEAGTTRVYLVRHARSAPSPELDLADYPLAPEGRAQAEALVEQLAGLVVDQVHASPWPRARDTVAPLAAARGLEVREDAAFRERRVSDVWEPDWVGWTRACIEDPALKRPGCESWGECAARVLAGLEGLARGRSHLVGTHGQVLAAALPGLDAPARFRAWRGLEFPDLRLLERDAGGGPWRWVPGVSLASLEVEG